MSPGLCRATQCKDYARPLLSSLKDESNQNLIPGRDCQRMPKDVQAPGVPKLSFLGFKYVHGLYKLRVLLPVVFWSYKTSSDRTEPSSQHLRSQPKELVSSMTYFSVIYSSMTPCADYTAKYQPGCSLGGIKLKMPFQNHHRNVSML